LEADPEGREFGLRLPGTEINLDSSPGHTTKCLESLALFQPRGAAPLRGEDICGGTVGICTNHLFPLKP